MLPSTQTFVAGAIAEGIAILMLLISVFVTVGSPTAVMATLLVSSILGIIASTLAMILAVVGMVRYRRMFGWNVLLLIASIVFNPLVWGALLVLAL